MYNTIIELSKCLVTCRNKADRAFIKDLVTKVYDRETKDEIPSRMQELEDKVSALSLRNGITSQ